jgi:hypothetical protein
MKKLLMMAMAVCLTMAAAAQRGHGGGGGRVVVVRSSVGYGYSPFYYSPFGYSPFGYPYGYNNDYRPESKLDRKLDEIKSDYSDKIKSAKSDKSVPRAERKNIVGQLKADRDKAVHDTKANYYKTPAPVAAP